MKKLILCILCLLVCSVCAAAAPAKKAVLWYQIPDVILEVQNPENDLEKGKVEFEAFLKEKYGKRFNIQILKRAPEKELTPADVSLVTRPNYLPVVVKLDLAVADGEFCSDDYGVKQYDSSMLRVAGYVVASEDDPRINTKNAVNDCIIDACTLNEKVNRYADPAAYAKEQARYKGEFNKL